MTTPFPSAFGNWNGRETAITTGYCIRPPIGCGRPIGEIPFTDELSRREYAITGMCQDCQDEFEAEGERAELHADCISGLRCLATGFTRDGALATEDCPMSGAHTGKGPSAS